MVVQVFLIVSEVCELYRQLGEACGKNSCYVSSTSELMVPNYNKTKRTMLSNTFETMSKAFDNSFNVLLDPERLLLPFL